MKNKSIELLCCPACKGRLRVQNAQHNGKVEEGFLCPTCERLYPVKDDIVHFISEQELEGLNLRFARFYERFSRYEAFFDKLSFLSMGGERKARQAVLKRLEFNRGKVLEVSIGSGGNLPFLFESPDLGDVYGLDISEAQLTHCHERITESGWPVSLFLGMAEALPFQSESFDTVFHLGGINFFSDKKRAIDEMVRVCRPGSKIVIADESEQAAKLIACLFRLSRSNQGRKVDTSIPLHLVPQSMENIRSEGIWKRHGHYHGYVLEFRKPL